MLVDGAARNATETSATSGAVELVEPLESGTSGQGFLGFFGLLVWTVRNQKSQESPKRRKREEIPSLRARAPGTNAPTEIDWIESGFSTICGNDNIGNYVLTRLT